VHPQSQRLAELLSARVASGVPDDLAAIVLGPRLRGLCDALGAPERDWWQLARWATRLDDADQRDAFGAYLDVLVAYRCGHPGEHGEDVVSDLIAHEVDGDGLTADEIREILVDFVRAGAQPV
jgi:cytochrome P450